MIQIKKDLFRKSTLTVSAFAFCSTKYMCWMTATGLEPTTT